MIHIWREQTFLKTGLVTTVLAGLFIVAACSSDSAQAKTTPTLTATSAGKALFVSNCAVCHNNDALGGKQVNGAVSADLRWAHLGEMYNQDKALIKRAILDGQDEKGRALDDAMPRWRGKLTDSQISDIIDYLATLK